MTDALELLIDSLQRAQHLIKTRGQTVFDVHIESEMLASSRVRTAIKERGEDSVIGFGSGVTIIDIGDEQVIVVLRG